MNSLAIFVAAATLGVDYGWQYAPNGQLEYLIQIEPALLDSMENGLDVASELLPEVRGVRKFRISVGNKKLPRETIVQASAQEPARSDPAAGANRPPLDKSRPVGEAPGDRPRDGPRNDYADRSSPIRPAPLERDEPDRVEPSGGRPIEQSAAKPSGADAGADSPSSEMSRLTGDSEKSAGSAASADDGSLSPWFVGTIVALCASLGANFYQGWNLKSARRRYYQLVDRLGLRPPPGSDGISIEGFSN